MVQLSLRSIPGLRGCHGSTQFSYWKAFGSSPLPTEISPKSLTISPQPTLNLFLLSLSAPICLWCAVLLVQNAQISLTCHTYSFLMTYIPSNTPSWSCVIITITLLLPLAIPCYNIHGLSLSIRISLTQCPISFVIYTNSTYSSGDSKLYVIYYLSLGIIFKDKISCNSGWPQILCSWGWPWISYPLASSRASIPGL